MKNLFFLFVLFCTTSLVAQDTIPTSKATQFIGKEVWVKGTIASLKLAPEGEAQITSTLTNLIQMPNLQ